MLLHRPPLAAPLAAALLAAAARAQDNVLIVLADDMGVDMVGGYQEGPDPAPTPTIDSLAQMGILFRNCWAAPACSPARAMIQTGRWGFRTGVGMVIGPSADFTLPRRELMLPEALDLLSVHGYSHAYFGKWHLDNEQGDGVLSPNLAGWSHFAGSAENLVKPQTYYDWTRIEDGAVGHCTTYATTQVVDDCLQWIGTVPEPWVALVAFQAPHEPFHEPPANLHTQNLPPVDPRYDPRPFYKAMIEAMDNELQRLIVGLGPQRPRTNIVFLADNGTQKVTSLPPFEPEHAKLTPFEGGLNVPMIVSGPAVTQFGAQCDALVSAADVFSTVLELAGVDVRRGLMLRHLDSVSLVPYFSDPGRPSLRGWVFGELFLPNGQPQPDKVDLRAIRDERFKLIRNALGKDLYQLYDLSVDPFETTDLTEAPLGPEANAHFQSLSAQIEALLAGG